MAPGSQGVGAVFACFSGEDSGQTGDATGEPRVPRRSRSRYLSNAPGLADQLVASRERLCAREGGSCAAYFCKVPGFAGIRAWVREIWFLRTGAAGVFLVRFEDNFPIRIPVRPDKILAIREFHVVHECVFFPTCPGLRINLLRVRKTLCASVATSDGKILEISAQPYFVGLFSRAWPCTEASLGSQDMILRSRGRWNVPYAKGTPIDNQSSPIRPRVWHLNPNTLRGDLTWGLPKLQIKWSNGLAFESKHVGEVNLRLQICSSLKSGGSTVWHLNPNTLRGDLTWGLPKLQIEWNQRFGTLNPNTLGCDLAWGLPKSQIECLTEVVAVGAIAGSDRLAKGKAVAELDAEAVGLVSSAARPPPRPGVVIGRSTRPSGTTRPSPQPSVTTGHSDTPSDAPRHPHTRSTGVPPLRLKRQRAEGIPDSAGAIPEDYVAPGFRYPPQGGIRPRYPVAVEISDTLLLTNFLAHPSSLIRRCQEPPESVGVGLLLLSLYLAPRLGRFWVSMIRDAIDGSRRPSVRVRYLADILRRDREEPPTELRYRQWAAYFIFCCFLRERQVYRSHAHCRHVLRHVPRRRHFAGVRLGSIDICRLPLAPDPDFPLARRWDSSRIRRMTSRTLLELRTMVDCIRDAEIVFQPYPAALTQRPELGGEAVVPVDPSPLMTIEDYIPRAPSDPYVIGVSAYPSLVREDVPYQEWFEQVSLGSLMSLHEVEGGRVMGGMAMDSHHIRSSGQIERLQSEILSLQLELSVSEDRHTADMDRAQGETARMQAELTRMQGEMIQLLEDQLQGVGIPPVTGAGPSGFGQTSSPPPPGPVSRDWFFDDPPSS
uniref:Aminotransferase-like plant mobile domain-containing protein n=1 Tax=Fagus sylvatica TaxID=28930 RepID=A0A2N9I241_FAGSY